MLPAPVNSDPADALLVAPAKIRPPLLRAGAIERPQLLQRLDAALRTPITLVAAPAGFGKTTLVSQWLIGRVKDEGGRMKADPSSLIPHPSSFGWLSLDSADNDPIRFVRGLIAAVQTAAPRAGVAAQAILRGGRARDPHVALMSLLRDLEALDGILMLVLDDLHVLDTPGSTALLAVLVEQLPPALRLVLAGRADPALPLARLRARGQLCELRAADLRFSATEAHAFLVETLGVVLEAPALDALVQHTEGWAAGLQLAGLALQHQEAQAQIVAFSGAHRFVLDYLADEVLEQQPPAVQRFLLATSLAERLCAELCATLLGACDAEAGAAPRNAQSASVTLAQLERANLFLVPLDAERRWYRYHHLFAELLRYRLHQRHPELVAPLHQRAARWFASQGLPDEAIHHALAAGDADLAATMIATAGRARLARGEFATLQRWLAALPPTTAATTPRLLLLRAWSLVWQYQPAAVADLLPALADAPPELVAEVLALRAFVARSANDNPTAVALSTQALERLADDPLLYGFVAGSLGDIAWFTGDPAGAVRWHGVALACADRSGDLVQLVDSAHCLAQFELLQGRLSAAEAANLYGAQLLAAHGSGARLFCELLALSEAGVALERGELDTARAAAVRALQAAHGGLNIYTPFAQLELARVAALQGERTTARQALLAVQRALHGMVAPASGEPPLWFATLDLRRLEVWLALGDSAAVAAWAGAHWTPPDPAAPIPLLLRQYGLALSLAAALAVPELHARLQPLATQPLPELALAYLASCLQRFAAWGLGAVVLDLQICAAVVYSARGDDHAASEALGAALALAAPEQFVRPFVSRGASLRPLLDNWIAAREPNQVRQFATYVLALLPDDRTTTTTIPSHRQIHLRSSTVLATPCPLPERLSLREREVLPLLAAGLSHREIAARLTIAPDTARTHIKNIYGKLQARNRVEALAQARAHGLL